MSDSRDVDRAESFPNFSDAATEAFYGAAWSPPDWDVTSEHELVDVRVLAVVEIWDGMVSGLAWTGRKVVGFSQRQVGGGSAERTYVVRELISPPPDQIVVRISEDFGRIYVAEPTVLLFGRVLGWFRELV